MALVLAGCHLLLPFSHSAGPGPDLSPETGADSAENPGDGTSSVSCEFRLGAAVKAAFCEGFVAPAGNGGRSGDLDPAVWMVSRRSAQANAGQGSVNLWPTAHIDGCGSAAPVTPPEDVRVCNGRLFEASNDGGSVTILALSATQPFDWTGRTGTVVFDVSADSAGMLGAWPALWITDQPSPAPYGADIGSGQPPDIRNGFGFTLALNQCAGDTSKTGVDSMAVIRDYKPEAVSLLQTGCVGKGSASGGLNHVELRLSQSAAEVWASDPGSPAMVKIAEASDLDLPLTRGVLHLEDVHHAAFKGIDPSHTIHTFAWDNIGFDGPKADRYLSFDVPDGTDPGTAPNSSAGTNLGHVITSNASPFKISGVSWNKQPTGAAVTLNWFPLDTSVPSVRLNAGPWQDTAWPFADTTTYCWRSTAVTVPLADVRAGDNTIDLLYPGPEGSTIVANISLVLTAAAPAP